MRLGEALGLGWNDVDLHCRAIRLREAKAGARTVHLGGAAVTILAAIPTGRWPGVRNADAQALCEAQWRRAGGVPHARHQGISEMPGAFVAWRKRLVAASESGRFWSPSLYKLRLGLTIGWLSEPMCLSIVVKPP